MGITLIDRSSEDHLLFISLRNWHAIVETVRRLRILPDAVVNGLHEPFCGNGLTREQAAAVADHLRLSVIPVLASDEHVLLDGKVTRQPQEVVLRADADAARSYSTTRQALEEFATYCDGSEGFEVC